MAGPVRTARRFSDLAMAAGADGVLLLPPYLTEAAGPGLVVVTGCGVVSPVGLDTATYWASLVAGRSGMCVVMARRIGRQTQRQRRKPEPAMKPPYRELVTINGKNVVLAHNEPPVVNAGVLENEDIFRMINIFAEKFSPSNIDKADGTPLRLYTSDRVKIDVSKRRKHDMGFWHRNIDAHEIIFCVKGALKWETEMGVKIMHPGDMLFIPKGIGHRSMLCEDSTDENVLIELKIADELTYVGENK